jgi:hypothetical protein
MSTAPTPTHPHHAGDPRPAITRRQLSYAIAASGSQAAQAAQSEGIDPEACAGLLQMPVQIGPVIFAPVSMQTLLALQMLMKRRSALGTSASPISSGGHDGNGASTAEASEETDLFALAEAVLVFASPQEAAMLLRPSVRREAWEERVIVFAGSLLPADLRDMGAFINEQMGLLRRLGGDSDGAVESHPQSGQPTQPPACP